MCDCGYDLPTIYKDKMVVARKDHICYECRKPIPKKTLYENHSGLWHNQWRRYKICIECADLHRKVASMSDDNCGAAFGEVRMVAKELGVI